MTLDIKETPSIDYLLAKDGPCSRAIVFNFQQARAMFSQPALPDLMLCIDSRICKWVTSLHEAHSFYNSYLTVTCPKCKCDFTVTSKDQDLTLCSSCGGIMIITDDSGIIRKKFIQKMLEDRF